MRHQHQILLGNNEDSLTALLQAQFSVREPNANFTVATTLDALIHHATRVALRTGVEA